MKPLLSAQAAFWRKHGRDPDFSRRQYAEYLTFSGPVDAALLAEALRGVLSEFEVLRSRFYRVDAELRQVTQLPWDPLPSAHDVSTEADPLGVARSVMADVCRRPFDLSAGPLLDYTLFKVSSSHVVWHARYHPILTDGIGCWMIAKRAAEIYDALLQGTSTPAPQSISLDRLLEDEARYLASERSSADRDYWWRYLHGYQTGARLPGKPDPGHTGSSVRSRTTLGCDLTQSIRALALRARAPVTAAVIAAAVLYLHHVTSARDIALRLVVAAREGAWKRIPARAVNEVPLRLLIEQQPTLLELTERVSRELRAQRPRWRYRGYDSSGDVAEPGEAGTLTPVVNVMHVRQLSFGGKTATAHAMEADTAGDLRIVYYVREADIVLALSAPSSGYCRADLERYTHGLVQILEKETTAFQHARR